jgi:hypothetical protein
MHPAQAKTMKALACFCLFRPMAERQVTRYQGGR